MKQLLTILAVVLVFTCTTSAAVYYVDNFGNDANSGLSETSAWKTISKLNSKIFSSGDIILFKRGGKWYETLLVKQNNLTFGAYGSGENPLIDGQMTRSYNIYMSGRSGVTIKDFSLINAAGSGSVRIESGNNCVVQNCNIYVTSHGGVFIQNSRNCIVRGINVTTPDNTLQQTDGIYSQRNNGNIYESNYMIITNANPTPHVDGIQCYLDTSITARNNYIEQRNPKTGEAQGIYATNTFGRFYFYNNIINTPNIMSNSIALKNLDASLYKGTVELYHNTVITRGGNALCIQNAPDFRAKNNIFISRGTTYAVTVIGSFDGSNLDYNIYYNYGTDPSCVRLENGGGNHSITMLRNKGLELHGIFGNPMINTDFVPVDNSPVIDKGTVVSLCGADRNGTVRPQGLAPDFGALEKISTVVIPLPEVPDNLTAEKRSSSVIFLCWSDVSTNEKGFYLERFNGTWNRIAVLGANVTSYTDSNLTSGTSYIYRIQSFNDTGVSGYSNTSSATTDAVVLPPVEYDEITIEATNGNLSSGACLVSKSGSISNQVVQFTSKSKVEFSINIPGEADWYLTGRFFHAIRSNAFAVQINGGSKQTFSNNKIIGQWAVGPKIFLGHLSSGTYLITVTNTKPGDGSLLDLITLTTNSEQSNEPSVISVADEPVRNYPNPFNPSTKISFQVPTAGIVELSIYNSLGEQVASLVNEEMQPGNYEVQWNASRLASGIYFCRMTTGNISYVQKMILTK